MSKVIGKLSKMKMQNTPGMAKEVVRDLEMSRFNGMERKKA